jgi:hypothetical protein
MHSRDLSGHRAVSADDVPIWTMSKSGAARVSRVSQTANSGFAQYTDFGEQNQELNSDLGQ